jgi:hypothetical protein
MKTYGESGYIDPLFLASALDGGISQLHAPNALHPGKNTQYPWDRKLGGPQSRSERRGVDENLSPLPGIEPQPSSP